MKKAVSSRYVTDAPENARLDEPRFRLYRLCPCPDCDRGKIDGERCPTCRGEGRTYERVAECETEQAVGVALVTLGREGEWEDCPVGLLDTQGEPGRKWLVRPWLPSPRNVSDAARTLAKSKGSH